MPHVPFNDFVHQARLGECLISFPTDTVPALAVRPDRADLIFTAKQRRPDKPLILMAATIADLWQYVTGNAAERQVWEAMADRYLPGALTLVLPASDRVPPEINPTDRTTIGLRVPHHAIAQAVLAQTGALATTSANLSGQPPLLSMDEIAQQFPDVLTLARSDLQALGGDTVASGVPSTVIRWNGNGWDMLRQGAIVLEA